MIVVCGAGLAHDERLQKTGEFNEKEHRSKIERFARISRGTTAQQRTLSEDIAWHDGRTRPRNERFERISRGTTAAQTNVLRGYRVARGPGNEGFERISRGTRAQQRTFCEDIAWHEGLAFGGHGQKSHDKTSLIRGSESLCAKNQAI